MPSYLSDVAFTPAVRAQQVRNGSREAYARRQEKRDWPSLITDELAKFIAERDSIYLATASADGQPYIQHRGGKPGFVKVLDQRTLGFADFGGNRQFISAGNLSENDRAHMFLMDYANRLRIKIWGRARVVDDPALLVRLTDADGHAERAILFEVLTWDVNCPQHITPRYSEPEIAAMIVGLKARIAELEASGPDARRD